MFAPGKEALTQSTDNKWRLILDDPMDGSANMRIDRKLLNDANDGLIGPTLRLYSWNTPTLSIGYAQDKSDLNHEVLSNKNIPVVRRVTGGRAVLHDDEVTYSICVPATSKWHGDLSAIYGLSFNAIYDTLEKFSLPIDKLDSSNAGVRSACCFSSRTKYEITIDGRKVVASAQRRLKNAALQHGSIILSMNTDRYLSLIEWPSVKTFHESKKLMGGINDGRAGAITPEMIKESLITSFEKILSISFHRQ